MELIQIIETNSAQLIEAIRQNPNEPISIIESVSIQLLEPIRESPNEPISIIESVSIQLLEPIRESPNEPIQIVEAVSLELITNQVLDTDFLFKFGSGPSNTGGEFNRPREIAFDDTNQKIYVVDTLNNRVEIFDSAGVFQSEFGSLGPGDGEFDRPEGIEVDEINGFVYVADFSNNRIQKFDLNGGFIGWLAGCDSGQNCINNHSDGFSCTASTCFGIIRGKNPGQLANPNDVVIDNTGRIIVADQATGQLQVFDSGGNHQFFIGSFGSGPGQLDSAVGVAVDSDDNIYVADSNNQHVSKFNKDGIFQNLIAPGLGQPQFDRPFGIAVDSSNRIYVAESPSHRIQVFNSVGNFVKTFGQFGFGDGQLRGPRSIDIDDQNNIYIVDLGNNRIQVFGTPTSDLDRDGIQNEIDTQQHVFSNDFTDEPLGGTTTGTVLSPGDQIITILEEPNPDGVRIITDAAGGSTPAQIRVCGGAAEAFFPAASEVRGICSSVILDVISGIIQTTLIADDGSTAEATLDSGDSFSFDNESFTMESTAGTAEVVVIADDGTTAEITLTEGNAITVDPETSIITADPDNPTDVTITIDGEETTVTPGGSAVSSPEQAIQNLIDELNSIVSENPGTPLAAKVGDASSSVQTALAELNKTPPDNQAAAGNIEGGIGSLEVAIKDNGLDQTQGELLIDQILTVSRQLATNAISIATNTPGSDAGKISSANAALAKGDSLRTPPTSFGDFKSAAAEYKVAIAEAEGAIP